MIYNLFLWKNCQSIKWKYMGKIKIEKYVLREHKSVYEMNHRWEVKMVYNELE